MTRSTLPSDTTGPCTLPAADSPAQPAALLDAEALAALALLDPGGRSGLVRRVMTTYRSSLARLLAQLGPAREQGNLATVRLVTHTLKSSSASIGALGLSALCASAEQAVRDGRHDALAPLLEQLEAEAVRVDVAVLQLLSDPATPPR